MSILLVPGGIIHLIDTEFNCPECTAYNDGVAAFEKLDKAKRGYIYYLCPACKRRLFITTDMTGKIVVLSRGNKNIRSK